MLTARYHVATIIAIFLSLGIGIVIGGTLGQKWAVQAEDSIVDLLSNRYDMLLAENQAMKKRLGSLERFLQTLTPAVQDKVVWWYRDPGRDEDLLAVVLDAAGVHWVEKDMTDQSLYQLMIGETQPDYILVTDPEVKLVVEEQLARLVPHDEMHEQDQAVASADKPEEVMPRLIDVSERVEQLSEPKKIVDFMLYMKQLVEEESYAATSSKRIRDRAGME